MYIQVRFGMYDMLKGFCGESQRPLSTLEKVLCAAVAGATGAFAGNPGDLAMVRMQVWPFSDSAEAFGARQADGKLPVEQRAVPQKLRARSLFRPIYSWNDRWGSIVLMNA